MIFMRSIASEPARFGRREASSCTDIPSEPCCRLNENRRPSSPVSLSLPEMYHGAVSLVHVPDTH